MGQAGQRGAPLLGPITAPVRNVGFAFLGFHQRGFIAQSSRKTHGGVQLHARPVEVAAVGVNVRQRQHRMQGSQVIAHLAGKIQRLFQER